MVVVVAAETLIRSLAVLVAVLVAEFQMVTDMRAVLVI
jgi:hypothetical protein